MYGLSDALIAQIVEEAERFHALKLVLFGSRARGDFRASSDIDLAVYGLLPRDECPMRDALEALPSLLKFDMIPVRRDMDAALIEQIRKDGVVLMERRDTKLGQFKQALARTKEAICEYDQTHSSVVRDGAIQRFEFSAELAWKTCREHLLEEGFVGIDSPKAVMRQAFAAGLIEDEQGWLDLLQARNITSHMYSEKQADEIYLRIASEYVELMDALTEKIET